MKRKRTEPKRARRGRNCCDAKSLQHQLAPFVQRPDFLVYPNNMMKGKLDRHVIVAKAAMLKAIQTVQSNFCFTQRAVEEALHAIQVAHPEWKLQSKEASHWQGEMAKRVRTLCCHVAVLIRRKSPPAWFKQVLAGEMDSKGEDNKREDTVDADLNDDNEEFLAEECADNEEDEEEFDEDEEDEEEEETQNDDEMPGDDTVQKRPAANGFYYGFDPELKLAWRLPFGAPSTAAPEYSVRLFAPQGADLTDDAMAEWQDGSSHAVAELTAAELESNKKPGGTLLTGEVLFCAGSVVFLG